MTVTAVVFLPLKFISPLTANFHGGSEGRAIRIIARKIVGDLIYFPNHY